ncbi:MAG TPA: hypothetical protein VJ878_04705, partial [Candidatus Izemoplasmatales bacterium]|nr:hypothetical protein [Candidatus Izemoplasmatales bacterium]
GWTKSERDKICNGICGNVVFVSPIQGMILDLATRSQQEASECGKLSLRPWVFSNDTREKIELPNGEVISVLAKTGWYLE